MTINTKSLVSISEANQNFSKVARLVDENGTAIILKTMCRDILLWSFQKLRKFRKLTMRI